MGRFWASTAMANLAAGVAVAPLRPAPPLAGSGKQGRMRSNSFRLRKFRVLLLSYLLYKSTTLSI